MSAIENVLSRLKRVREDGDGWKAQCPAHDDKNPSLSVGIGDEGRALLKCFAGCTPDAIVSAMGLRMEDLFSTNGARSRPKKASKVHATIDDAIRAVTWGVRRAKDESWRPTDQYSYFDGDHEVMRMFRFEPLAGGDKTYRPVSACEGGWRSGDPDGLLPLYRAPQIQEVARVFLVEGEKCADAAAEIGLAATTSAHGAKSPLKTDWSSLAGCDVVILPDRDEAGEKYARAVERILLGLPTPARVKIVELPDLGDKEDVFDFIAKRRAGGANDDAIRAEIERLAELASEGDRVDEQLDEFADDSDDPRPLLQLGPDHHTILDELEVILAHQDPPCVFNRGGNLVRVIHLPADTDANGIRREVGTAIAAPFDAYGLCDAVNRAVRFYAIDEDEVDDNGEPIKIFKSAPLGLMREFLARKQWRELPVLQAVVAGPVILSDGTIIATDGYHRASGMFVDLGDLQIPRVPDRPTREDAVAALNQLDDLIDTFPFVSDDDRAVAIAGFITPIARPCFAESPMFCFSAPSKGTGKSLLIDGIATAATGHSAAAMSQANDEDETRKLILSLLMESGQLMLIDNCTRPLGGASLCMALTQSTMRGRVLGFSATATVSTRQSTWFGNGNNLVIAGDLGRRALVCMMDAKVERPWTREFKESFRKTVLDRRPRILHAILTIVRWGIVTKPQVENLEPYGGFEGWSQFVRTPLIALGAEDPVSVLGRNEATDPERNDLLDVMDAWAAIAGTERKTCAEVVEKASGEQKAAFRAVAGSDSRGEINTRRLGHYLLKHAGKRVEGRWFERVGDFRKTALWRLAKVEDDKSEGSAGLEGSHHSSSRARAHTHAHTRAQEEVDPSAETLQSHDPHTDDSITDRERLFQAIAARPNHPTDRSAVDACSTCTRSVWWRHTGRKNWTCAWCSAPSPDDEIDVWSKDGASR